MNLAAPAELAYISSCSMSSVVVRNHVVAAMCPAVHYFTCFEDHMKTRPRFARLSLEPLEQRCTPTTYFWQGAGSTGQPGGDGIDWNDAANWLNFSTLRTATTFPDGSGDLAIIGSACGDGADGTVTPDVVYNGAGSGPSGSIGGLQWDSSGQLTLAQSLTTTSNLSWTDGTIVSNGSNVTFTITLPSGTTSSLSNFGVVAKNVGGPILPAPNVVVTGPGTLNTQGLWTDGQFNEIDGDLTVQSGATYNINAPLDTANNTTITVGGSAYFVFQGTDGLATIGPSEPDKAFIENFGKVIVQDESNYTINMAVENRCAPFNGYFQIQDQTGNFGVNQFLIAGRNTLGWSYYQVNGFTTLGTSGSTASGVPWGYFQVANGACFESGCLETYGSSIQYIKGNVDVDGALIRMGADNPQGNAGSAQLYVQGTLTLEGSTKIHFDVTTGDSAGVFSSTILNATTMTVSGTSVTYEVANWSGTTIPPTANVQVFYSPTPSFTGIGSITALTDSWQFPFVDPTDNKFWDI
jgi:hypothetical protein